jgi:integrase
MARIAKKLNVRKIKTCVKPGHRYGDGDGLFIQVTKTGVRSWIFRYVIKGRERWMGLGALRFVSLEEARKKADAARVLLKSGIDPLQAANDALCALQDKQNADAIERASQITFANASQQYFLQHRPKWSNLKHAQQFLSTMQQYVFPVLGELPVGMITTPLVREVLDPIWETKTVTAKHIQGRIAAVLGWAKASGYRDGDNPAVWKGHLDAVYPAKAKITKVKHHAALAYDDVPAFVALLPGTSKDVTANIPALALEFLILTAARSGEVAGARFSETDYKNDYKNKVWIIPAERMKGRREQRVPLVDRAIAILKSITPKEVTDQSEIFGIGEKALPDVLEGMGYNLKTTVHGFRSSFRDWAAEQTAFPRELAEVALAHRLKGGKTEEAYQRSDLLEKRRVMMEAWATFVKTPKRDATVTPIGEARAAKRGRG